MDSVRFRPRFGLLRLLGLLAAVVLASSGCTNKALGIETEGRNINPARDGNVIRYHPDGRKLEPKFAGEYVTGGSLDPGEHLGSVTVVNFWASWCTPCIAEQPVLERTGQKYESRGVRFIGINIRDTLANAKAFFANFDFEVTYPSIFDRDQRLAHAFRVTAPPSTFVLDREGRVAARVVGGVTEAGELDVLIDEVLAE